MENSKEEVKREFVISTGRAGYINILKAMYDELKIVYTDETFKHIPKGCFTMRGCDTYVNEYPYITTKE